jgi:hypothetical protein
MAGIHLGGCGEGDRSEAEEDCRDQPSGPQ